MEDQQYDTTSQDDILVHLRKAVQDYNELMGQYFTATAAAAKEPLMVIDRLTHLLEVTSTTRTKLRSITSQLQNDLGELK